MRHFDGRHWTIGECDLSPNGASISKQYLWAVTDTSIHRYDGESWATAYTIGYAGSLRGIWAKSDRKVYAVGAATKVLEYDGFSWTAAQGMEFNSLAAIHGSSSDNVWAVGYKGAIWRKSR